MQHKSILTIDPLHPYELELTADDSHKQPSSSWDEIELYRKTWERIPQAVKDQICQQCPGLFEPYFDALEDQANEQINLN